MKSIVFNTLLGIAFLLTAKPVQAETASNAGCPDQEFTRVIKREFTTTSTGTTAMYNKYGKINVKTWNENRVKIDITIVVNASDQRSADRTFERINVNFTNTAGYVKAETVIEESGGMWPGWPKDEDFKINYEVWMPVGNQLDLKNKYGNAYVTDLNGKLMAEIKYGDLRTEKINNDADLYLGYGKAAISSVRNLYGEMGYGTLYIGVCNDLQMDTKYSEIKCDKASAMRFTSKYDDFVIGAVDDMRLQTKYSDVKLQQVRALFVTASYTDIRVKSAVEIVDANLSYGNLNVENLAKGFSTCNVVGKYTDVFITAEPGAAYRIDAECNYTDLHYPSATVVKRQQQDGTRKIIEGYHGNAGAKGLIKVRLSYGDLIMR